MAVSGACLLIHLIFVAADEKFRLKQETSLNRFLADLRAIGVVEKQDEDPKKS